MCFAAKASSGGNINKGVVLGEDGRPTIEDRYDVVDNLHGRGAVHFFLQHVHGSTLDRQGEG